MSLKSTTAGQTIEIQGDEISRLRAQRDALLSAAKATRDAWMPLLAHGYPELKAAHEQLCEAIRLAESKDQAPAA